MTGASTTPPSLRGALARLPRLAAGAVRAANRMQAAGRPRELEIGGRRVRLEFGPPEVALRAVWSLAVGPAGSEPARLEIDTLDALLPGLDNAASAPAAVRAAILAQLAELVDAALGLRAPLPPLGEADTEPPEPALVVGIRATDVHTGLRSRGRLAFRDLRAADACAAALARLGGRPALAPLPVELRFHVGHARLSPAELRGLEPGDVILHARVPSSGGRWRAAILAGSGRTEVAAGHVKGDRIVTDRVQVMPAPARPRSDPLEAVSVDVGFEIGRCTMALDDLLRLAPGHVFELGAQPEGEIVELTLAGAPIGTGQLVLVGTALGVRVVRLQLTPVAGEAAMPQPAVAATV